jgi:hypothetical protein
MKKLIYITLVIIATMFTACSEKMEAIEPAKPKTTPNPAYKFITVTIEWQFTPSEMQRKATGTEIVKTVIEGSIITSNDTIPFKTSTDKLTHRANILIKNYEVGTQLLLVGTATTSKPAFVAETVYINGEKKARRSSGCHSIVYDMQLHF